MRGHDLHAALIVHALWCRGLLSSLLFAHSDNCKEQDIVNQCIILVFFLFVSPGLCYSDAMIPLNCIIVIGLKRWSHLPSNNQRAVRFTDWFDLYVLSFILTLAYSPALHLSHSTDKCFFTEANLLANQVIHLAGISIISMY